MTKAVLYARFSPRPGAELCESIEVQLERCRAQCVAKAWEVVSEHEDRELSGGRADNRPGLQSALEASCKHKAVLVVYSLSRLARNTADAITISQRLEKCGANLFSLSETIDTTSPTGRFTFTLFAALATLEREQIGQRTSDAMQHHQQHGRIMTRAERLPYGNCRDPQNKALMIPDETEQNVIRQIVDRRKRGDSCGDIVAWLEKRGIQCRGSRWYRSTVLNILKRANCQ